MYKLLIADDETLEREALRYFVSQSSLDIGEIIECSNGNEVVRQVLLVQPDIIILDITMPGLNGLEAFAQFKDVKHPYRVIFSTAFNYFEYAVKALQLGAMDFLVKPVRKEQLLSVIIKAVDQLDAEAEKADREQKLKNVLDIMGGKMLKKLIIGDIDDEVLYYLDAMDIPYDSTGQCFCIRTVNPIGEEGQTDILKAIKKEMLYLGVRLLGEWHNDMLSVIAFFTASDHGSLAGMVQERIRNSFAQRDIRFALMAGSLFEDLGQVEQSFALAREHMGDIAAGAQTVEAVKNTDMAATIQQIKTYIENNFQKHLTLDMIAGEFGYSKFYINRMFKQQMNTTIMDYLIQTRINRAKELLAKDMYTVKQISSMVGYSEPNYFTITFKKAEGVSPIKYRYQSKEEAST